MTNNRSELIEKLQNLLKMTIENGCSENEAEIAARKVNDLLIKYNLSLSEVERSSTENTEMDMVVPHDIKANGKKDYHHHHMPDYLHHLAVSIGRLNFCEVIGNNTVIYLGTKKDTELAAYMFQSLIYKVRQQAAVEFKNWVKSKYGQPHQPRDEAYGRNHPNVWKESWVDGACSSLGSKFFDIVRQRDSEIINTETTALVISKHHNAVEFAKTKFPVWYGLKEPTPSRGRKSDNEKESYRMHNSDAWRLGYEKGKTMNVDNPLSSGANHKSIGAQKD